MTRTVLRFLAHLAVAAVVLLLVGFIWIRSHHFSARDEPGGLEAWLARHFRSMAMRSGDRDRPNPVPASPEGIRAGLEHFADHCAVCHANDGSGQTELGRGLYPRAPDMRRTETQSLSDGELFYIIENGVRFTGMPAWGLGSHEGEEESWRLVRFIRHLPALTREEIAQMERLNPKAPGEMNEEREMQEFLKGKPEPPSSSHGHKHPGGADD